MSGVTVATTMRSICSGCTPFAASNFFRSEAPSIFCAQAILNQAGGRRKQHVRSDGGHHDEVDLFRLHAFCRKQFLRSLGAKMRSADAWLRIMPFTNTSARADPFVIRVHFFFEIEVGDYARGHVSCNSGDLRGDASTHSVSPGWN